MMLYWGYLLHNWITTCDALWDIYVYVVSVVSVVMSCNVVIYDCDDDVLKRWVGVY